MAVAKEAQSVLDLLDELERENDTILRLLDQDSGGGLGGITAATEGVATQERPIIREGTLTGYVLSSYSARRLGLQTTGNAGGARNLLLEPGGCATNDLVSHMGDGLLVTEVMGQGVNLVTGDYSRGAAGFRVENGQIAFPVEEITIAGNLRDMYANVAAAGCDVDTRGNIHCGHVLICTMMVAGS